MRVGKWFVMIVVVMSGAALAGDEPSRLVGPEAAKAGLEKCAAQWEQIGRYVEKNTQHTGSHIAFHTNDPDNRIARMAVEEAFSDGSILALISATPSAVGTCDATLARISVLDQSCLEVAMAMGTDNFGGQLGRRAVVLRGNPDRYLLPVGDGCLVVNFKHLFGE